MTLSLDKLSLRPARAWTSRRIMLAIVLLAVLLRVAVALYLGDTTPPAKDETSYSTLALRLATGYGYTFPVAWYPFAPANTPTAHWSFLYTAFLSAVYAVAGPHPLAARLLQALLTGILMPWLTYRLAKRMLDREAVALLAALLSAVYAYFILFDVMVQTEAFFICAVLWSLERAFSLLPSPPSTRPASAGTSTASTRPAPAGTSTTSTRPAPAGPSTRPALAGTSAASTRPALAGTSTASTRPASAGTHASLAGATTFALSLALATLLRQSILPWIAFMLLYLLVARWRARGCRRAALPKAIAPLVLAGLILIACIAPFTIRNYRAYGQFLLLNSNAGYAMYSAQHPLHGTTFQEYAAAPLPADLVNQGLNEAQWDKALMARGIGFVLADPGRYLLLSLSRVADYFEFWPTAESSLLFNVGRLLSFTLFLPFMIAGIVIAARRFRWQPGLVYLFMAVYSVLHIFTWAMSRYRLPVDAVALPFAALALVSAAQASSARRKRTRSHLSQRNAEPTR